MDDELRRRKEKRRQVAEKKELQLKEEKEVVSNNVDNEIVNNHEEIIEKPVDESSSKEEIQDDIKKEEPIQEIDNDFMEVEKKKGGFFKIIFRIIGILVFLFILFETVIGIINMNQLNNDKEPVWYLNKNTTKEKGKTETTYNLGLYVIVNTTQGKEKKIALKPFFLK